MTPGAVAAVAEIAVLPTQGATPRMDPIAIDQAEAMEAAVAASTAVGAAEVPNTIAVAATRLGCGGPTIISGTKKTLGTPHHE